MNADQIRAQMERDGWPIEVLSETTFRSRFRGAGGRVFPVFVHIEPLFMTLAVIPFSRLPVDEASLDALLRLLLRYNRDINLAKFSVDEDGDVILSVEYRRDHLDPSEVRDAFDVLSFYADKCYPDVERLAGDLSAG